MKGLLLNNLIFLLSLNSIDGSPSAKKPISLIFLSRVDKLKIELNSKQETEVNKIKIKAKKQNIELKLTQSGDYQFTALNGDKPHTEETFELLSEAEKNKKDKVIFVRLEQLYPFPAKTLANVLKRYKNAEFIWCQEEPKNMGAWNTMRNYIDRTLEMINFKDINVKYIGRKASSSTATGNANKHLAQQKEILEKILKN